MMTFDQPSELKFMILAAYRACVVVCTIHLTSLQDSLSQTSLQESRENKPACMIHKQSKQPAGFINNLTRPQDS
jgi:hypothetical protein